VRLLPACELPERIALGEDLVIEGDAGTVLDRLPDQAFELIYIDPPWGTGQEQRARRIAVERDEDGERVGFGGRRYRTRAVSQLAYADSFEDYAAFLRPKLERARELLTDEGTLYVHLDYRAAHYVKVALDEVFGRDCFLNEIIWAYDYGAKPSRRWPAKHDTILVYVRDPRHYLFDAEAVDREPYMAPGLVGAEKAARGKRPTDTWWHTIVPTNGSERTGYPTQKPEGVLRRIVAASSRPGGWCLDFFAGSGTLGAVAAALERRYVLVDSNPAAIAVISERLRPSGRLSAARSASPSRDAGASRR
jgi:site-specific DNA-methyltransferase (adenine-specific)